MRRRLQREREDRLILAWESAALGGAASAGKLPPLDECLARVRPRVKLTAKQMLQVFRDLQGAGAPITITQDGEGAG